jgi:hypothetical protein
LRIPISLHPNKDVKIQNSDYAPGTKYSYQKCNQICPTVKFVEQTDKNSDFALFALQDLWVKLRFEVLFKKFYPRINLTTLFWTKINYCVATHVHAKFQLSSGYPDELRQIFDHFSSIFQNFLREISKFSNSENSSK